MRSRLSAICAAVGLVLVSATHGAAQAPPGTATATAAVRDRNGQMVATADLREVQGEVVITLTFPQQAPLTGTHAVHIHETGRCGPPDFTDAGGIFNPLRKQHGLRNPDGPMVGDLPDLALGPTGLVRYSVTAPLATLQPGPTSLLGPSGTAIVIDAGQDDNVSQPAGNSGARIACGVILAPGQTSAQSGTSLPLVLAGIGLIVLLAGVGLRVWRLATPHAVG